MKNILNCFEYRVLDGSFRVVEYNGVTRIFIKSLISIK